MTNTGIIIYAVWQHESKCEYCGATDMFLLNFEVSTDINLINPQITPTEVPYYVCNSCKKVAGLKDKDQRYKHIVIKQCQHESTHTTYIKEDVVLEMCIRCGKVMR